MKLKNIVLSLGYNFFAYARILNNATAIQIVIGPITSNNGSKSLSGS